jgi:urease accessory protein
MQRTKILLALSLVLSPALAVAHPGHDQAGLAAGLGHPLLGLDHLLAMLAVGWWAAQQLGAARWAMPLSFLASMLLGGLLGFAGLQLPLLEGALAGSVLALGLLVAVAARLPLAIAIGLCSVLALSHGLAHGLELPNATSPWSYATGFLLATALLHAGGYALVRYLPSAAAPLVRWAGVGSAAAGGWWLLG